MNNTYKLPIPKPSDPRRQKPWYIQNWSNDERSSPSNNELKMTCVPGKVGMDSGTGFHSRPCDKFPTTRAAFAYEVFFPSNFDFVKGGKLPGFSLGTGTESATGGDWKDDAGSVRIMWRENGQAIGYVYLPLEVSKKGKTRDGTILAQGKDFQDASEGALGKHAGIDLFFKKRTGLKFKKGVWNKVKVEVKLNSIGNADGYIEITVNDETRRAEDIVFRKSDDINLNLVLSQAFFGGSSKDWAAKKIEKISFRNFELVV